MLWTNDETLTYDQELRDLKDRTGNVIEEGRFNIVGLKKFPGWAGVHHIEINAQKVLD